MVEALVRDLIAEEVILWVTVATLVVSLFAVLVSILSVYITFVYGEIQRRLANRQLRLAEEEAELRPELSVAVYAVELSEIRHNPGNRPELARIYFDVKNGGRSAASNIRCRIEVEDLHQPPGGGTTKEAVTVQVSHLGPKTCHAEIPAFLLRPPGWAEVVWSCVCDEVGETQDIFVFDASEFERDAP